jgi:hypothetical protein
MEEIVATIIEFVSQIVYTYVLHMNFLTLLTLHIYADVSSVWRRNLRELRYTCIDYQDDSYSLRSRTSEIQQRSQPSLLPVDRVKRKLGQKSKF